MTALNGNKQAEKRSACLAEKIDEGIIWFVFSLSAVIFLSGLSVLGYQVYFWLQRGYWQPLPVSLFLLRVLPTNFLAWLVDETTWVGLKKMVFYVFHCPLSFFLICFSLVVFYAGCRLVQEIPTYSKKDNKKQE